MTTTDEVVHPTAATDGPQPVPGGVTERTPTRTARSA